jgi:putative aldouronate transport system permease protein
MAKTSCKSGTGPRTDLMKRTSLMAYLKQEWLLYVLLLPGIIYAITFQYIPLLGSVIAFKEYDMFMAGGPIRAMIDSPWVGIAHFQKLFSSEKFYQIFINTLAIGVYKILFLFPLPILLAILINEMKSQLYKRSCQTLLYLPHFLSWVVISGLFIQLLGPYGPINRILLQIGILSKPIDPFTDNNLFRSLLVGTAGWKETGWNTIVYLAAITAIDPEMYEAAYMDGANKLQQILKITIPSLIPTILMLFTIRLGYLLDAGFDQVFNMYNATVYEKGDIIGTYVYRVGIGQMDYSFSTAVGLFNSVIALILILTANKISRKYFGRGIW